MNNANSTDKVQSYLENLTKDELIHFVLEFAPPSFIENIKSQFASEKEVLTLFDKVSKAIDSMLSDEELLYKASGFEREATF